MVNCIDAGYLLIAMVQADQPSKAPLERLDPPTRAAVIMTIFALVLLGLTLVAGIMIGARWVRRMARHRPRGSSPTAHAKSISQSLATLATDAVPDAKTDATVQIDASTKETKVDR
jgi:hypothetical protein